MDDYGNDDSQSMYGYGSSDEFNSDDGDLDGFQIEGEMSTENDAADAWLRSKSTPVVADDSAYSIAKQLIREDKKTAQRGDTEQMGRMTAADLQLGRFGHVSEGIRATAKAIAMGQSVTGVDPIDAAAAREQFAEEIGGDPAKWAKQLRVDAVTEVSRSKQDIKTALSMLQTTSGDYLDRGPGSVLPGNIYGEEKQAKTATHLAQAIGYIDEIADLYIHPETKKSSIYGTRKAAVKEALTSRMMEGVFYEGANWIVPNPNELSISGNADTRILGLNPTRSYGAMVDGQWLNTTAFTRVEFGQLAEKEGWDESDPRYWAHNPSSKESLFPKARGKGVDKDKAKRDQEYQFEQARYKLQFARNVLRREMPTHRDETAGQLRMSGFDRPYGEQAERADLINEASIQGLDYGQASGEAVGHSGNLPQVPVYVTRSFPENPYGASGDLSVEGKSWKKLVEKEVNPNLYGDPLDYKQDIRHIGRYEEQGKGSDRGGKYGYKDFSEVDMFVEQGGNPAEATVPKDIEGIEQGTPEWYTTREGMVTASKLTTEGGELRSPSALAALMARERMGGSKFIGNSYTEDGKRGESLALNAFLNMQKSQGNPLVHTEVGLLQHPDLPGMGASPDGRLHTAEGDSAGLLELKYLTSGSMKKALKKYNSQMQLQMAVANEKQTHFFALNKYTGESIHEVVKADPEFQKQMIGNINEAISIESGLDARGVQALEKLTAEQRSSGTPSGSGQDTSFQATGEGAAMGPFRPSDKVKAIKAERARNQTIADAEQAEGIMLSKAHEMNEAFDFKKAKSEIDSQAVSARAASRSLAKLTASASKAGKALVEIANVAVAGNKSAMDEVRFAAATGMDPDVTRGMRNVMNQGGMTDAGISATMRSTASLVRGYNDEATASAQYTDLMYARGKSGLSAVRGLDMPSRSELQGMDVQSYTAHVQSQLQGKTREEKMQIANMYGVADLAAFEGEDLSNIVGDSHGSVNEVGARKGAKSIAKVEQAERGAKELAGENLGTTGGFIAGGLAWAGDIAGSATAALAGLYAGKVGLTSKAASVVANSAKAFGSSAVNSAKAFGSSAANSAKGLSTVAKAHPVAIAATLAPMAARNLADIEDDNSLADSGMDILEMAAWGAGVGSFFPGPVTAGFAAAGLVAGVATETYQYFQDDAVPSENIGKVQGMSKEADSGKPVINNIEVNTTVTKEGTTTEVSENGENIYMEEDNSTGW